MMEIEELLYRKHMKDAQRGRELLTDKEYIELEKQWETASKDARIRPVEIKINPKVDLDDLATMDDFVNEIVAPRTTKMRTVAEAWEKRLLEEAYRLCAWRISYVSWYEWDSGICHCYTRVWPAWQTKQALKFAKEKGEHVVTLNFKKWLTMSDKEFFCKTHGSANYETALKLRKLLRPIVQRKCKRPRIRT